MRKLPLPLLVRDRSGSVAVLVALAAIPLVSMVALAVDLSMAYRKQSGIQAALDSTALMLAHRSTMNPDMTARELIESGKSMVAAKVYGDLEFQKFTVDTRGVDVQIEASAKYDTFFAKVMGLDNITISGNARAQYDRSEIDFYVMVDNSSSMGIGATMQDIETLENSVGCAFACHTDASNNNYDVVRAQNVTLRIDAAADAIAGLADRFERERLYPSQFRLAAYTFGEHGNNIKPHTLTDLTDDLGRIRRLEGEFNLLFHHAGNDHGQTDVTEALKYARVEILKDRNDKANEDRVPVLFLITDGVHDGKVKGSCFGKGNSDRCMMPMESKWCDRIKEMDVLLVVLHTEYLPLESNPFWRNNIKSQQEAMDAATEDCASPGYYFPVDYSGGSIERAMEKAFERTVRGLRLSNPVN